MDRMAYRVVKKLTAEYPFVRCRVVLAYIPTKSGEYFSDTVLPDGIETVSPQVSILFRNRYMIERSSYVITYIRRPFGGAFRFAEQARKMGKTIIDL